MTRLLLLDSASMYFRAFFGVPDRFHAADGTPVNAVRGFADAVARSVAVLRPDAIVACWDDDWRPAFRVERVPSYKAHRVVSGSADTAPPGLAEEVPDALAVQEPIIEALLAAVGISRLGAAGFEADDVIAQLCRDHADGPVDIVSGDRDLFQLVDDARGVRVVYTAKGMNNLQYATDDWLLDRYGVTGGAYADLALLRGDASDGLPGVPGIGEKTAASLLSRYGDLTSALAAAAADDPGIAAGVRKKLLAATDYLAAADPVVRLTHHVDLPAGDHRVPRSPADPATLVDLVDTYGLETPVNRLLNALAGR
ncbi:MAG: 5'-3' exonuclease [Candidatus Nanopelagicales bacterium]